MFREKFPDSYAKASFRQWLSQPGECPTLVPLDTTLVASAQELADSWVTLFSELEASDDSAFTEQIDVKGNDPSNDFVSWNAKQKLCFLSSFGAKVLTADGKSRPGVGWNERAAQALDRLYAFDKAKNSEIRMRWCNLGLAANYKDVLPNVEAFLKEQGRMKFVRPLFRQLHHTFPKGDFARELFAQTKSSYHTIARKMVERDLAEDQHK